MTRKQFEARAIRTAEMRLSVPRGWWGRFRDVTNGKARVRYSGHGITWIVSLRGKIVSRHDSRRHAIRKAAKL